MLWVLAECTCAFADVPMGWGGGNAFATLSITTATYGLAALAIVTLEAITFKLFFKCTWANAFFNSLYINVVSSIAGSCILVVGYIGSVILLFLLVAIPGVFLSNKVLRASPLWFKAIAVITLVVGGIASAGTSFLTEIYPKERLLYFIEISLIMGFGMTLFIEGLLLPNRYTDKKIWTALLVANLLSYLVLAGLYPYFAANPYRSSPYMNKKIQECIVAKSTEDALALLHMRRSNMQYLLGLTKNDSIKAVNTAMEECYLLEMLTENPGPAEPTITIAQDIITFMNPDPRTEHNGTLLWFHSFFGFYSQCLKAILENDQSKLDAAYNEWVNWYKTNPYKDPNFQHSDYQSKWEPADTDPTVLTKRMLGDLNSDLVLQSE